MKRFLFLIAGLLACTLAMAEVKVAYPLSEGIPQAARAWGNIGNHLAVDTTAKVVLVSHSLAIDFMLDGATNPKGQAFAATVSDLVAKGVEFRACNNTLQSRNISPDKLLMASKIVPS